MCLRVIFLKYGICSYTYGGCQVPRSAVRRLEIQENPWHSSSVKARRLETREEPMFPFESEGRNKAVSQLGGQQAERILS